MAAVVLGAVAAAPVTATAQVAPTRTLVITAIADTTLRQAQPTTSAGGTSPLVADRQELSTTGSAAHVLLRFEVPGLAAGETVTAAHLRLHTSPSGGGTADGPAVWRTANTSTAAATEALTWNSRRPARQGTSPVGDFGASAHDARTTAAVRGVTGNGWVTFELAPASTDGLSVRSREHTTADQRPQLVLTLTSGGTSWPSAVGGSWSTPIASLPQRTVHAAVLRTGKVLLVAGSGNRLADFDAKTFTSHLWDPGTNALTALPNAPHDVFCAGHAFLPDGRLLVAGGTSAWESPTRRFGGSTRTALFDPVTRTWTPAPDMAQARWYPTVVSTGDGRIVAASGFRADGSQDGTAEVYDVAAGEWVGTPVTQAFPNYPQLALAADGRLFYSGMSHQHRSTKPAGLWDVAANRFTAVPGLTNPGRRNSGATVLLPPAQSQQVLAVGGGDRDGALAEANLVDLDATSPAYVRVPDLPFTDGSTGAMHLNAVLLPDGKVFTVGGTRSYISSRTVHSSATFDPATRTWQQMNPHSRPRGYHSTAVLLPDGRVATFGHDLDDEATFDLSVQVWSPPYLHAGTRPTISAAPTEWRRGSSHTVSASATGASLHRFVLVRPSAVTHSLDPDQRVVALGMTAVAGGATLTPPTDSDVAPSGWYMLFAVDSLGRPSTARWVHLT